jgi:hypothetical protein
LHRYGEEAEDTFRRDTSITSCVGAIRGSRSSRAGERVTLRSSGVEQRFRKVARGVDEQTGVEWCRGNALRQLEEGKAPQKVDKVYLITPKLLLDATEPVKKEVHVTLILFDAV